VRRESPGIPFSDLQCAGALAGIIPWLPRRRSNGGCGRRGTPRVPGAWFLVLGVPRQERSPASHACVKTGINWAIGKASDLPKIVASGDPCPPSLGIRPDHMCRAPPSLQARPERCAFAWHSGIRISPAKMCKGLQRVQAASFDPPAGSGAGRFIQRVRPQAGGAQESRQPRVTVGRKKTSFWVLLRRHITRVCCASAPHKWAITQYTYHGEASA